jgi:hypothetical protein
MDNFDVSKHIFEQICNLINLDPQFIHALELKLQVGFAPTILVERYIDGSMINQEYEVVPLDCKLDLINEDKS